MEPSVNQRHVAAFLKAVYDDERKALRRKPKPEEWIIAAMAIARIKSDAGVSGAAPSRLRRGERLSFDFSGHEIEVADEALLYLRQVGDRGEQFAESDAVDRYILGQLANAWISDERPNETAIGRKIGLKHTSVRDRKIRRCARIAGKIRLAFPEGFEAGVAGSGRVFSSVETLTTSMT